MLVISLFPFSRQAQPNKTKKMLPGSGDGSLPDLFPTTTFVWRVMGSSQITI